MHNFIFIAVRYMLRKNFLRTVFQHNTILIDRVVQPVIVKNIEREKTHEADMLLTR